MPKDREVSMNRREVSNLSEMLLRLMMRGLCRFGGVRRLRTCRRGQGHESCM